MSYIAKKTYVIVCEGNSENAYIQELNRFLDDGDYSFTFVSNPIRNGHYKAVTSKYQDVKRKSPRSDIFIWVDKDTYQRNDDNDGDNYSRKPSKFPDFMFSFFNFEDFLVMHMDEMIVLKWQDICEKHGHFENPMYSEQYMPLLRENIFPNYKKGEIPFEITKENFENLLRNQQNLNIKFKCDFAEMIAIHAQKLI